MNERISPAEVGRPIEGIVELELEAWRKRRAEDEVDPKRIARGASEPSTITVELVRAGR